MDSSTARSSLGFERPLLKLASGSAAPDLHTSSSTRSETISPERPVFEDPRQRKDRRVSNRPDLIPEGVCRRKGERRSDRINLGYWWMKRSYGGDNTVR